MFTKERLEFYRLVAQHIEPRRLFGWFIGLAVPAALALQLFIAWHDSVIAQVRLEHLLLRAAVGLVVFGTVVFVVYWKAMRPAIRKAAAEMSDVSGDRSGEGRTNTDSLQ